MKRWTAYTRLDWALLWRFGTAFDQTRAKTENFGGQQKRLISSKRTANFWRLSCFPTQDYHVAHMFCTLHEISYSVGIVKLMAFYVFYQQNCDEVVQSKTAVFQFWQKVDFWQNWCANIALFKRFAFRYHHFNNMGHEANWITKRLHMVRLSTFLLLSFDAGSRMSEIKKIVWSRQNVILLKTLCKLWANALLCVSISDWFKYDYETEWNAE